MFNCPTYLAERERERDEHNQSTVSISEAHCEFLTKLYTLLKRWRDCWHYSVGEGKPLLKIYSSKLSHDTALLSSYILQSFNTKGVNLRRVRAIYGVYKAEAE